MKRRIMIPLRKLLPALLLLLSSTAFGQTVTLTFDNVPAGIRCNETWTEAGLDLRVVETTADDQVPQVCTFSAGSSTVAILPARLTVNLSGLLAIQKVEVDVNTSCGGNCTRAFITDESGSIVDNVGNRVSSGLETLTVENPSEGLLGEFAVSSTTGIIREIRIYQNPVILPVEWLGVSANALKDAIEIIWSTSLEVDNAGFAVERSVDGVEFVSIFSVAPNESGQYRYLDQSARANQEYVYRIRQTDVTGAISYSSIVSGMIRQDKMMELIRLYPNPSNGTIYLEGINFSELDELSLINAQGQPVFLPPSTTALDVSQLPDGVYLLRLVVGGEIIHKRLVKNGG